MLGQLAWSICTVVSADIPLLEHFSISMNIAFFQFSSHSPIYTFAHTPMAAEPIVAHSLINRVNKKLEKHPSI